MIDDMPDWGLYMDVVGGLVAEAAKVGRPIRAFGEMVAVLWKAGNTAGVIKLEKFWNDLAKKYDFTLFCGYPMYTFDRTVHGEVLAEITHLHTQATHTYS
jgi:hypothetical protein